MGKKIRIECSYKPKLNQFGCPNPSGGAFIAKRRVKVEYGSIYFVYCDLVEVADLSLEDKRKWASVVYWNDVIGDRAFIPGTKEWRAREIFNYLKQSEG